mmetsp:Transcript_133665/g.298842  ORF Transcript_133665/g.298842 Transcript_133665/m.298842 type:complete len:231 (+) Transcript_133665:482-1174(+)
MHQSEKISREHIHHVPLQELLHAGSGIHTRLVVDLLQEVFAGLLRVEDPAHELVEIGEAGASIRIQLKMTELGQDSFRLEDVQAVLLRKGQCLGVQFRRCRTCCRTCCHLCRCCLRCQNLRSVLLGRVGEGLSLALQELGNRHRAVLLARCAGDAPRFRRRTQAPGLPGAAQDLHSGTASGLAQQKRPRSGPGTHRAARAARAASHRGCTSSTRRPDPVNLGAFEPLLKP